MSGIHISDSLKAIELLKGLDLNYKDESVSSITSYGKSGFFYPIGEDCLPVSILDNNGTRIMLTNVHIDEEYYKEKIHPNDPGKKLARNYIDIHKDIEMILKENGLVLDRLEILPEINKAEITEYIPARIPLD